MWDAGAGESANKLNMIVDIGRMIIHEDNPNQGFLGGVGVK